MKKQCQVVKSNKKENIKKIYGYQSG